MAKTQILLYYKYAKLPDALQEQSYQRMLCEDFHLKGRIIVAAEGINGTVEGTIENTERYIKEMNQHPQLFGMNWKKSEGTGDAFPRLSIKVRDDLVTNHFKDLDVDPTVITGKYLSAETLHDWIHGGAKEFYIVDMRNDYEHKIGFFAGSILPALKNFRDLPAILPTLEHLRDKTVVTVCTGGIRCEKASGFLVKHGFKDVYQLHNGIVTYMEKYPEEDFKGKLYVFDGRIAMGFNSPTVAHEIVGRCLRCNTLSERYVNCSIKSCNMHFICCETCSEANGRVFCSDTCAQEDVILNANRHSEAGPKNLSLQPA